MHRNLTSRLWVIAFMGKIPDCLPFSSSHTSAERCFWSFPIVPPSSFFSTLPPDTHKNNNNIKANIPTDPRWGHIWNAMTPLPSTLTPNLVQPFSEQSQWSSPALRRSCWLRAERCRWKELPLLPAAEQRPPVSSSLHGLTASSALHISDSETCPELKETHVKKIKWLLLQSLFFMHSHIHTPFQLDFQRCQLCPGQVHCTGLAWTAPGCHRAGREMETGLFHSPFSSLFLPGR